MGIAGIFRPRPTLSDQEVENGLRMMTLEGIAAMAMFSVTTSGILAAFALALGANNLQIGILAAIPFITQPIQVPAILLVERLRRRKAVALACSVPVQVIWIPIALIPLFLEVPGELAVVMLLVLMAIRGVLGAVTNCAWNGWIRDLVPQRILGTYFSRRLALATTVSIVFGLAGAFFVDYWKGRASAGDEVIGYTLVLLAGAVFLGLAGPFFMALMPEPLMPPTAGPQPSLAQTVTAPLRDRNFRQLVNFLFSWGFAANLAIPFFTIYMLRSLGLSLPAVIALNTLAQIMVVLFLRVWGPLADRLGSKVILSTCVSLYLLVIIGWTFTTMPHKYALTVPLVVLLQIFGGVAAAGVNLTVGTIGLKLAPQGSATAYMAVASLAANVGAGLGALGGGLFSDFFTTREFSVLLQWSSPGNLFQFPAVHLTGFDFLFTFAFLIGLLALNTVTTIREEGEVGREVVLEELLAPTREMTRTIGSVPGVRFLGEYPYAYLRRVPGLDVALGVTAYQVASSVKLAVTTASRSGETAADVAEGVRSAVSGIAERVQDIRGFGGDLANHTARGAMNALDQATGDVGELAQGTVLGVLRALHQRSVEIRDAAFGAAQGTVQGAGEIGADVGRAAAQAVAGARAAARALGLSEAEAADRAAQGAMRAAEAMGPEVAAQVREALAEEGPAGDRPHQS